MMKKTILMILLLVIGSVLLTGAALAAGDYALAWWTVDGGGGRSQSTDGQYALQGTLGQPEAGSAAGGDYAVHGGFWQGLGAALREFLIHLPLVNR